MSGPRMQLATMLAVWDAADAVDQAYGKVDEWWAAISHLRHAVQVSRQSLSTLPATARLYADVVEAAEIYRKVTLALLNKPVTDEALKKVYEAKDALFATVAALEAHRTTTGTDPA